MIMQMRKKLTAMSIMLAIAIAALSGCVKPDGENNSSTDTPNASENSSEASKSPTQEDEQILVVGYDTFSGNFSPFFSQTTYDGEAMAMTQLSLLAADREGNIILNGIEGETRPYNGTDYFYQGIGDCVLTENGDGSVTYEMTVRDDVVFSDGIPMTIDDYIFSLYVSCDPSFDGADSIYAYPILGMEEYREGMSPLISIIGQKGRNNTDFTLFTKEQQDEFWIGMDQAGVLFTQDIVDYCVASFPEEVANLGGNETALAMILWGYGELSADATTLTVPQSGNAYHLTDLTPNIFWEEMSNAWKGDFQSINDKETARLSLFTYFEQVMGTDQAAAYNKLVALGETVDFIEGIQKTGDYSVSITMSEYNTRAIYSLGGLPIAPLHYYGNTELYDYENHRFGFPKGDLISVREGTKKPLGAGPYIFESYENGVITYRANPLFVDGEPKIQTVLFRETSESDKLSGIVSGAFDIINPNMELSILSSLKEYNSNGELTGDLITTSLVDMMGYASIGINANTVKVGSDKAGDASKNLRKALATMFAFYREEAVNSYFGELGAVINSPISNTSWAELRPSDEGYQTAYSMDVSGQSIYQEGMSREERRLAMIQAVIGYLKAAGYRFDEQKGIFTEAPEGAEMTYEVIYAGVGSGKHPATGVMNSAKEDLAALGITLLINDPSDSNMLWNKLQAGTQQIWAQALNAPVDPDMYQSYYSTNVVEAQGTQSNYFAITDEELDQYIMLGRQTTNQTERKQIYKKAMDIVMDWGVEVPFYQRKNGYLFSTQRVNVDTITPDITPFWGWMAEIHKMEMNE
jgi:peptide/nickel transport system substrate-binding protein